MKIEPFELIGKTVSDARLEHSKYAGYSRFIIELTDGTKVVLTIEATDELDIPLIIQLTKEFF